MVGLWGKAISVPHPAQVPCISRRLLSRCSALPGQPFLLSAPCTVGFISVRRCFKALFAVPGSSTSAEGHGLCPRGSQPRGPRVVEAKPRFLVFWSLTAGPAPRALPSGIRLEMLGLERAPRFPGPPANTPGRRGRDAAGDVEAPGPFRDRGSAFRAGLREGREGAGLASLEPGAQVAHLGGSQCGLIGLKRS